MLNKMYLRHVWYSSFIILHSSLGIYTPSHD